MNPGWLSLCELGIGSVAYYDHIFQHLNLLPLVEPINYILDNGIQRGRPFGSTALGGPLLMKMFPTSYSRIGLRLF